MDGSVPSGANIRRASWIVLPFHLDEDHAKLLYIDLHKEGDGHVPGTDRRR